MSKTILPICGSIGIQSYGFFVVLGILAAYWLLTKNPKTKKIISADQFKNAILIAIVSGVIGGRLLYIAEEPSSIKSFFDIFKIWEGGMSSLGAILGVLIVAPLYLRKIHVNVIKFFDLLAIYAPLTYAIARIGCFFAGCCFGTKTNVPWAIIYRNEKAVAPLCQYLHPAQLYSSAASFLIFLLMYFVISKKLHKTGQLICSYLCLASIERFCIDFVRGDKTYFSSYGILSKLSTSQWISLLIGSASLVTLLSISMFDKANKNK